MEDTRKHRHPSNEFVGSAVVAGAVYGSRTTLLKLRTFSGELIEYTVGDIPDPAGTAEFSSNNLRFIAVQIQHGGKRCSVITLTPEGPRRSLATLGTALALFRSGAHTVVDGGLKSGVPCSIYKTANERRSSG